MKVFRLSTWLYVGLLFILVACQPIRPPTAIPAAQPTPAPTMASSPAAKQVVGKIIATIPVGNDPGDVFAIGGGTVWVPNAADGTVSRIDAKTNEVVATIPIGSKGVTATYGSPWAVALAAGSLWVTDNAGHAIVRLDPATNEVVATIPLEVEPFSLQATDEAVWVSALDDDQVMRIDPQTNTVVATIKMISPCNFAFTEGAVWVTNLRAGTVSRIDPQTNIVTATIDIPGPGAEGERPEMVVVGAEGIYVIDKRARTISLIDPATNQVILTRPSGGFVVGAAVGMDGVWAPDSEGGKLRLLNAKTLALSGELTLPDAFAVTIGEESVWVIAGKTVVRVAPSATVAEQKPVVALTTFSSMKFKPPMSISFGPEWHIIDDYTDLVTVARKQEDLNVGFNIVTDAKVADPVSGAQIPFPEDFVSWIKSNPNFMADEPTEVMVAGIKGLQIDATPTTTTKQDFLYLSGTRWNIIPSPERWRFILFNDVNGERLLILLIAPAAEFKVAVEEAQEVLDTVIFSKPAITFSPKLVGPQ